MLRNLFVLLFIVVIKPATATIHSLSELHDFAAKLAVDITPDKGKATVIGLCGPLGAGKTAFVQELLSVYGVRGPVTSPTYTIETVYQLPDGPFSRAYHLDAYRLDSEEDLEALDFSRRLQDPENLILIEWAGQVQDLLPTNTLYIDISFGDDADSRLIKTFYGQ